jgi:hypothetical protein
MPTYQIETDQGRYQLELDQEVSGDAQGHALLERLLHEQLRGQSQAPQTTPGSVLTQVAGGIRDFAQQAIDTPVGILNAGLSFVNPQPPGPGRQPPPYQIASPQLPNTAPPQTGLEKGVRVGAEIGTDVLAALAVPGMKTKLARLLQSDKALRPPGLMFEPGRLAARGGTGIKPVPTLAKPSGPLLEELSEGATNLATVLQLPRTMPAIRAMTLPEATTAVQRLLASVGEHHQLTQQAGPVRDLFDALQAQVLRYR